MRSRTLAIAGTIAALSLTAAPIAAAVATNAHPTSPSVRLDHSRDLASSHDRSGSRDVSGSRHADRSLDPSRDTHTSPDLTDR